MDIRCHRRSSPAMALVSAVFRGVSCPPYPFHTLFCIFMPWLASSTQLPGMSLCVQLTRMIAHQESECLSSVHSSQKHAHVCAHILHSPLLLTNESLGFMRACLLQKVQTAVCGQVGLRSEKALMCTVQEHNLSSRLTAYCFHCTFWKA